MKTALGGKPEKRKIRPATIQEHLRHQDQRRDSGKLYPEDLKDKAGAALEHTDTIQQKLQNAGTLNPEERANLGGAVGAHLGNKVAGAQGALIGAAIGSDATRGLGMAQSGEADLHSKKSEAMDALQKMNIISENGEIKFKDGALLSVSDPDTPSLMNTAPNIQGKPKRTVYELDNTNPFTSRTTPLVMPIAYYLVGGVLQQDNLKDPMTMKVIDCTATLLTNALQVGAKSMDTINVRAQEMTRKMKVSNAQMKNFFYTNRDSISEKDADKIKTGLETLYRK